MATEMDHPFIKNPNDPSEVKRQLLVRLKDASHKFTKMWIEKNNICGLVETLSNDNGINLARMAHLDDVPIGFSCRAIGKVKNGTLNGQSIMEVTQPTVFVTYDAVTDPSHKSAELKDITGVITNAADLEKFRTTTMHENDQVIIDESNELISLMQYFRRNQYNSNPIECLVENFMGNEFNGMSPSHQKNYVHNSMNGLLSEYLSSSDKVNGISNHSVLNESNVHNFMHDYAYNRNQYNNVSVMKSKIEQFLG